MNGESQSVLDIFPVTTIFFVCLFMNLGMVFELDSEWVLTR